MSKSDGKSSCLHIDNDGDGGLIVKIEGERHDTLINLAAMVYSVSKSMGMPEQHLIDFLPELLEIMKSKMNGYTRIDAKKIIEAMGEKQ